MQVDIKCSYQMESRYYRERTYVTGSTQIPVICADFVEDFFMIPRGAQEITVHLSTEEEEDSYYVEGCGDQYTVVHYDGPGSDPIVTSYRHHERFTYLYLWSAISKFPDRGAWLSITVEDRA